VIEVVGTNHRLTPTAVRERLARPRLSSGELSARARAALEGAECVLLRTCNRIELYLSSPVGRSLAPQARGWLCGQGRDDVRTYCYGGEEAVGHLFLVACGLDSAIVGEREILGQVRAALAEARASGAAGPALTRVFQQALAVGKRVRRETTLAEHASSLSDCAARLAQAVGGDLEGRHVLLIGAGQVARRVGERLSAVGAGRITVLGRSLARARPLAERLGGRAVATTDKAAAIREADIVVACAAAPHFVVRAEQVREAMTGRGDRLLLLDLGLPRNVEPAVGRLPGVHLFGLDDLEALIPAEVGARREQLERLRRLVAQEAARSHRWLEQAEARRVIRELRARAERARRQCLARAAGRLSSPADEAVLDYLSGLLVRKILHAPVSALRAAASHDAASDELLSAAVELFGLPPVETGESETVPAAERGAAP